MLVQWYCPPAVGCTDAISAMLRAHAAPKMKMMMMPYISVTGPPEATEMASVAAMAAQLLQMFHPMATMASSPRSRDGWVEFSTVPKELDVSNIIRSTISNGSFLQR